MNYRCLPLADCREFNEAGEYIKVFRRKEVDALIIWGANDESRPYLAELQRNGYPFLLLTNQVDDYPSVYANQREAMRQLVIHCRNKGAGRIIFVTSPQEGDSFRKREQGFYDGMGNSEARIVHSQLSIDDGYAIGPEILKGNPDAVICVNDGVAIGIEKYLLEKNVNIPGDMLLTGGDNIELSKYCQIPLTTFDQMAEQCAKRSVEILLDNLIRKKPIHSEMIEAELKYRASTGD